MPLRLKRNSAPTAPGVHPQPLWSYRPQSDREAGDAIVSNFALHWFPAKVYKPSLDWSYSFWLGTISAALLLLLVVSGLPLLFLYVPSVERAYGSVKDIEWVVTFGSWIRSVHRLSAHLMVAAVFLHLVRVFLTGAYKNGAGRGQRGNVGPTRRTVAACCPPDFPGCAGPGRPEQRRGRQIGGPWPSLHEALGMFDIGGGEGLTQRFA